MCLADIKSFFEPVFRQAQALKNAYDCAKEDKKKEMKLPIVTVCREETKSNHFLPPLYSCLNL